jgi:hypothetical protein
MCLFPDHRSSADTGTTNAVPVASQHPGGTPSPVRSVISLPYGARRRSRARSEIASGVRRQLGIDKDVIEHILNRRPQDIQVAYRRQQYRSHRREALQIARFETFGDRERRSKSLARVGKLAAATATSPTQVSHGNADRHRCRLLPIGRLQRVRFSHQSGAPQ